MPVSRQYTPPYQALSGRKPPLRNMSRSTRSTSSPQILDTPPTIHSQEASRNQTPYHLNIRSGHRALRRSLPATSDNTLTRCRRTPRLDSSSSPTISSHNFSTGLFQQTIDQLVQQLQTLQLDVAKTIVAARDKVIALYKDDGNNENRCDLWRKLEKLHVAASLVGCRLLLLKQKVRMLGRQDVSPRSSPQSSSGKAKLRYANDQSPEAERVVHVREVKKTKKTRNGEETETLRESREVWRTPKLKTAIRTGPLTKSSPTSVTPRQRNGQGLAQKVRELRSDLDEIRTEYDQIVRNIDGLVHHLSSSLATEQ